MSGRQLLLDIKKGQWRLSYDQRRVNLVLELLGSARLQLVDFV